MNKAFEKILERLEEKLKKSEERYHRYLDNINLPCVFDKSDIEVTRADTIKEMLETVQEVAEEYNGGWIACSERLPEENGHYLIFDNRGMIYESTYLANMWLIAASTIDVIAWQPLPEPFKERD